MYALLNLQENNEITQTFLWPSPAVYASNNFHSEAVAEFTQCYDLGVRRFREKKGNEFQQLSKEKRSRIQERSRIVASGISVDYIAFFTQLFCQSALERPKEYPEMVVRSLKKVNGEIPIPSDLVQNLDEALLAIPHHQFLTFAEKYIRYLNDFYVQLRIFETKDKELLGLLRFDEKVFKRHSGFFQHVLGRDGEKYFKLSAQKILNFLKRISINLEFVPDFNSEEQKQTTLFECFRFFGEADFKFLEIKFTTARNREKAVFKTREIVSAARELLIETSTVFQRSRVAKFYLQGAKKENFADENSRFLLEEASRQKQDQILDELIALRLLSSKQIEIPLPNTHQTPFHQLLSVFEDLVGGKINIVEIVEAQEPRGSEKVPVWVAKKIRDYIQALGHKESLLKPSLSQAEREKIQQDLIENWGNQSPQSAKKQKKKKRRARKKKKVQKTPPETVVLSEHEEEFTAVSEQSSEITERQGLFKAGPSLMKGLVKKCNNLLTWASAEEHRLFESLKAQHIELREEILANKIWVEKWEKQSCTLLQRTNQFLSQAGQLLDQLKEKGEEETSLLRVEQTKRQSFKVAEQEIKKHFASVLKAKFYDEAQARLFYGYGERIRIHNLSLIRDHIDQKFQYQPLDYAGQIPTETSSRMMTPDEKLACYVTKSSKGEESLFNISIHLLKKTTSAQENPSSDLIYFNQTYWEDISKSEKQKGLYILHLEDRGDFTHYSS